jgi:hypothetical protein
MNTFREELDQRIDLLKSDSDKKYLPQDILDEIQEKYEFLQKLRNALYD